MEKLLFVDDNPEILNSIRRMLYPMRSIWEMEFAASGEEALEKIKRNYYDVLISDIRMPNMDGVTLLEHTRNISPETIRIALSGQSDYETSLHAIGPIHQFLSKPIEATSFKQVLISALKLNDLLTDVSVKKTISKMRSLPGKPDLYNRIMDEVRKPEPSLNQIAAWIEQDVGISAKVLQLINSAFFGLPRHIESPIHAVVLLGLDTVSSLFLSAGIFSQFDNNILKKLELENVYDHSVRVGVLAGKIMQTLEPNSRKKDNAFIAGLMHDIGKLVYATNLPQNYYKIIWQSKLNKQPLHVLEKHYFYADHAQAGSYLLGLWNFPDDIVQAVVLHHQDREFVQNSPILARVLACTNFWEGLHEVQPEIKITTSEIEDILKSFGLPVKLASVLENSN
ncbi:MAG: two-component system response regulator [Chloroflexi bacterium HGW-Chloroflexi-10]|nr:MAG: two-component system response regulator [Chloroflexi bacterium HGW-Chloroflexi-10]